jgi:SPP1 gp7 family putative phage head morphogenesis protein
VPAGLEQQLRGIYLEVVNFWSRRINEAILPAYESFDQMRRDDDTDQLTATLSVTAGDGEHLVSGPLRQSLAYWEERLEEWHRSSWISTVQSVADVDVGPYVMRADVINTLNASLENNVNLIRSISDDQRRRTEEQVWLAVQQHTPRRKLAKDLEASLGIGKRRAINIARDQTSKLGSVLDEARQKEAGLDEYIWIHSGKVHFRPEHLARNKKKYDWDHPPWDGHPGHAINCGCHAQAFLDLGDD